MLVLVVVWASRAPLEMLGGEDEQVGDAARVLDEYDRCAVQHCLSRRVQCARPALHHHTTQVDALLLCTRR